MFYNREAELNYLLQRKRSVEATRFGELIVLYGRRRVGKTTLIQEFLRRTEGGIYLYTDLAEERDLFQSFSQSIREQTSDLVDFNRIESFFTYLNEKAKRGLLILALDEFQRLLSTSPRVITRLQYEWDQTLKDLPVMAVLMGSSIGMMQKVALSATAPLFGRTTGIQKIKPFNYQQMRSMFEGLNEVDKVRIYAVFGGTPYYLDLVKRSRKKEILKIIEALIVAPGAPLREEPRTLLTAELKEIGRYNSILHAIASGKATVKEISDQVGIEATQLPYYLKTLHKLMDLVIPEAPVLGKQKMGRYQISENFFRFWYRFIYPNFSALELGNTTTVIEFIKKNLDAFVGPTFEQIVREVLIAYNHHELNGISLDFTQIGRWWSRTGEEIDVVAVNERDNTILFGEVKWTARPVGHRLIRDLLERKARIMWHRETRKEYLLAVSRAGFTPQAKRLAREAGVVTLTLDAISKLWEET
ncbi:MAG: ATP-binding protein [Candidatus Bipolaricaulia bacterium]